MNMFAGAIVRVTAFMLLVLSSFSVVSCGGRGVEQSTKVQREFPMIKVPDVIKSSDIGSAEYVADNYWNLFFGRERIDALDSELLKDSSLILGVDTAKVSLAFCFYMTEILPAVDLQKAYKCVEKLIDTLDSYGMRGDRRPLLDFLRLSEEIYYDPNSPYRNEELYLPVVKGLMASKSLTELDKLSFDFQYKMLNLNRVGTKASDFSFERINKDGSRSRGSLYGIDTPYTLIFFNNPGCNSCADILQFMKMSETFDKAVSEKRLTVLAIYIDDDVKAWEEHYSAFPSSWVYARDYKLILRDNNIYGIRAIPSLYLLNREKVVLIKDAGMEYLQDIEQII